MPDVRVAFLPPVAALNPLVLKALRLLGDGEFHSGVAIAGRLGVTRAAVSAALQGVERHGVEVFRVHGRGYRLATPVAWLDRGDEALARGVGDEPLAHDEVQAARERQPDLLLIAGRKEVDERVDRARRRCREARPAGGRTSAGHRSRYACGTRTSTGRAPGGIQAARG